MEKADLGDGVVFVCVPGRADENASAGAWASSVSRVALRSRDFAVYSLSRRGDASRWKFGFCGETPSSVSAATPLSGLHDILNSRSPLPPFGINVRLGRQVSIDRRRSSWLRLYGERRREGGRTSGGRR